MGALLSLNLANNNLGGQLIGWRLNPKAASNPEKEYQYLHSDGKRGQDEEPLDGLAKSGTTFLANAIKNNRALTSLNLSSNDLGVEGAKIVAEAIKVTNVRLRSVVFKR
jgi:hypothetical protein